jgi:phage baseplate assembly protein W
MVNQGIKMSTIVSTIHISSKQYTVSEMASFKRMIETPLGSRVLRRTFGSLIHELIDMNMDDEFRMLLTNYLLSCFYDEDNNPWDERLKPNSVDLINIDASDGLVFVRVNFEDSEIELNLGGF